MRINIREKKIKKKKEFKKIPNNSIKLLIKLITHAHNEYVIYYKREKYLYLSHRRIEIETIFTNIL